MIDILKLYWLIFSYYVVLLILIFVLQRISVERNITKNQKALYNQYYEAQLPIVRADKPGLKLNQYKNMIFENVSFRF